jgi:hypothetical protein
MAPDVIQCGFNYLYCKRQLGNVFYVHIYVS